MVLGMVLDVVLDNSTQLADNQYWVLDTRIISFLHSRESGKNNFSYLALAFPLYVFERNHL